ncbi:hypothetical protein HDV00_004572 [Rhizophlyctis rosea]|nr:hypothetical protein HDV00_004572 [Rhizophlyctis rosea]
MVCPLEPNSIKAAFVEKKTLSTSLLRLLDTFAPNHENIISIPDTTGEDEPSTTQTGSLTQVLAARRETNNAMAELNRLLDQGDWKSVARIIASKRKRSELRSRHVLTWFFVRADAIADSMSDGGSPGSAGKGKRKACVWDVGGESVDSDAGSSGRSWADAVGIWFDGDSDSEEDDDESGDEGDGDGDGDGRLRELLRGVEDSDDDVDDPRKYYLGRLMGREESLTAFEAVELARLAIRERRFQRFWGCLLAGKLECTEELGDLFRPVDIAISLQIYTRANCLDKMIECLLSRGQYYAVIRLIRVTGQYEFTMIVKQLKDTKGVRSATAFTILVLR